jgi:hypothetical protein
MPQPINSALYQRVKSMADKKFQSGGLYKSVWMVHQYVKMGGKYRGKRDSHHGIVAAFQKQRAKRSKRSKRTKRSSHSKRK